MTDERDGRADPDDGRADPDDGRAHTPGVPRTDGDSGGDPDGRQFAVPRASGVSVDRPATESGTIPGDRVGPTDETRRYGDHTAGTSADGRAASGVSATGVRADGGATPVNVSPDGDLGDVPFTAPAEGVSADYEHGELPPDEPTGLPDGVDPEDLATPGYGIRAEMNDIETPDDKTWFMELDEAVIGDGRCIQCGTCVAACPSDSIGVGEDDLPELVKMCTGCSLCWDFCPRGGLRYERQWKITGGDDNVTGAGDPITEFSARVQADWREGSQDGGVVTAVLLRLLEEGEIDGALIATESDDEPWKAEPFLATTAEELVANTGTIYNQTLAVGALDLDEWAHKLPEKPAEELSLALVGTPCEIEGIRALQDFGWDYAAHEDLVRAVDYTIALMCTKNFNYHRLMGEQLAEKRDLPPEDIGKLDVLHGKLMAWDHDGEMVLEEDVGNFHDAALKGCDECADFTGYCADLTVGSVGSSDEYSSVIVRTETGLAAWELTEPSLDHHDLEDRSAIGKLQGWDKKQAFESLERPFDPDAPRFIDYADHAEHYGTALNPHESGH